MRRFFRWLKSLFKPIPDAPTKPSEGYEEGEVKPVPIEGEYKRIAIIVGHTKSAQGASTYTVNGKRFREYEWNKARAIEARDIILEQYPDKIIKIFYRDGIGRAGVAQLVGKWNADISLELHFNSIGHDRDAFGSEMLVLKNDDASAAIAYNFIDELCRQFNTKKRHRYTTKEGNDLRGLKPLARGGRGYENLNYLRKRGVKIKMLIEPFFGGTKTSESEQFIQDPLKYSRVLATFLGEL